MALMKSQSLLNIYFKMYPESCRSLEVPHPGLTGDVCLPGMHSLRRFLEDWLLLTALLPKDLPFQIGPEEQPHSCNSVKANARHKFCLQGVKSFHLVTLWLKLPDCGLYWWRRECGRGRGNFGRETLGIHMLKV